MCVGGWHNIEHICSIEGAQPPFSCSPCGNVGPELPDFRYFFFNGNWKSCFFSPLPISKGRNKQKYPAFKRLTTQINL